MRWGSGSVSVADVVGVESGVLGGVVGTEIGVLGEWCGQARWFVSGSEVAAGWEVYGGSEACAFVAEKIDRHLGPYGLEDQPEEKSDVRSCRSPQAVEH